MTELLLATETSIDPAAATRRESLVAQMGQLPDEAFTRLQYLQAQVGCFNRCAFCSQEAGADIWQISSSGLADLVAALVAVCARRGLRLGADRSVHRPGVLFPYLDNDIASYTHLEQLVAHCAYDLHVKLRISTVGYSRHHHGLAAAHQRIVASHPQVIDGIRFSLTPYTVGYRIRRDEYLADLAAALRTWKPTWTGLAQERPRPQSSCASRLCYTPPARRCSTRSLTVGTSWPARLTCWSRSGT